MVLLIRSHKLRRDLDDRINMVDSPEFSLSIFAKYLFILNLKNRNK